MYIVVEKLSKAKKSGDKLTLRTILSSVKEKRPEFWISLLRKYMTFLGVLEIAVLFFFKYSILKYFSVFRKKYSYQPLRLLLLYLKREVEQNTIILK